MGERKKEKGEDFPGVLTVEGESHHGKEKKRKGRE